MRSDCLMVQGTTSDAGKSVVVAGLCRLLSRRGIHVAPFKPQNMALNSAVTIDGGEIGRAQALQAIACGLEPHSDMNPVLLKPSSDTGAQVIVHGKVHSSINAIGYPDYKRFAMGAILESFDRMTANYETVLIEGAGSPAEINLRENDVANMGFAEAVDCPVIIVADIDRGGVFAHLKGTLDLLSPSEQQRVMGFVINRFRGDISLLQPGLDWLEQATGKPVWGVLPYLHGLQLDAEDAIAVEQVIDQQAERLKVVVPVLSRISNHTDFDALRQHPQVELVYCSMDKPMPAADLVILPGSKNVRADLALLKQHGWFESIQHHLRYGGKLLGICGGFQMLGKSIEDSSGVEDAAGSEQGLGLLDMVTVLEQEKQLRLVNGRLLLEDKSSGEVPVSAELSGYEIHCGVTTGSALQRPFAALNAADSDFVDGAVSDDSQVAGTYVHGLFDHPQSCQAILHWAGLKQVQAVDMDALREQQLDRLADAIEESIDFSHWPLLADAKCTGVGS